MLNKVKDLGLEFDNLFTEKIEKYTTKYDLPKNLVYDIFAEGWDLCCNFYEDSKGNVKEIIIQDQKPKYTVFNYAYVKDVLGQAVVNILGVGAIEEDFIIELLEKYDDEVRKVILLALKHEELTLNFKALKTLIDFKKEYVNWKDKNDITY